MQQAQAASEQQSAEVQPVSPPQRSEPASGLLSESASQHVAADTQLQHPAAAASAAESAVSVDPPSASATTIMSPVSQPGGGLHFDTSEVQSADVSGEQMSPRALSPSGPGDMSPDFEPMAAYDDEFDDDALDPPS